VMSSATLGIQRAHHRAAGCASAPSPVGRSPCGPEAPVRPDPASLTPMCRLHDSPSALVNNAKAHPVP
jgi:hypothetical protein